MSRVKNLSDNHNELQEVCADGSVDLNTLSDWASSFHASRVNIAVLPRSRKLSTASNDTLMFINSILENNTGRVVYETNISTASIFARKFAPKRIYQD
jgi:hypothetical protein